MKRDELIYLIFNKYKFTFIEHPFILNPKIAKLDLFKTFAF